MTIQKYPQLTEGFACRIADVDHSNQHALGAALGSFLLKATMTQDSVKLDALREGRVLFAKVNGMADILIDPTAPATAFGFSR